MSNQTLFLITARSGSKAIIDKNIKPLDGTPLLAYRIKQALKITSQENVWLSTDSELYAKCGIEHGALVPFIRPNYLASDDSKSIDVVMHALEYASKLGKEYEYVALLEPTSPFVSFEDIQKAINILKDNPDANGIVATKKMEVNSIFIQKKSKYLEELAINIQNIYSLARQNFEEQITPSGGFYISRTSSLYSNNTFYTKKTLSYILDPLSSIEIDNPIDWAWAEFLIKENYINKNLIM